MCELKLFRIASMFVVLAAMLCHDVTAIAADDDDEQAAEIDSSESRDAAVNVKGDELAFRLTLASGRTIEVGKILSEHRQAFEQSLNRRKRSGGSAMLRINHAGSDRPLLLASRRGDLLDGPFASFTEEGLPIAYVNYRKGERDSTLLTWDDSGRPLVFAQYRSGKIDAVRCLFRACCQECKSGHIWMVQEWDQGDLQTVHVVVADENPISVDYRYGKPPQVVPECDSALRELADFESRFNADELKLTQLLDQYHQQERLASSYRSRMIANQQRYRLIVAMNASVARSYRRPPVRSAPI